MSNHSLSWGKQEESLLYKLRFALPSIFLHLLSWFRVPCRWLYQRLQPELRDSISLQLAYGYQTGDSASWIIKFVLENKLLRYSLRAARRVFADNAYYPAEGQITLTTTRIIFTSSQRKTWSKICLKFWRPTDPADPVDRAVRKRGLFVKSYNYLLEGFAFNQKFTPSVYLGVASVRYDGKRLQRGRLISKPTQRDLKPGEQYAVVMYTLKDQQRLERQLLTGKIDADFLAREVAAMHRRLRKSPPDFGTSKKLSKKQKVNIKFYRQALRVLEKQFPQEIEGRVWEEVSERLREAGNIFSTRFSKRHEQGHIRRCHGDLKAANLWISSPRLPFAHPKLLSLDCIDFNPEFCNIDTLSDVAMLAVDLERLCSDPEFVNRFLQTYLDLSQEDLTHVNPLLEYYMTEKAMVCAYVSVLFDNHDGYENHSNYSLAMDYLRIAAAHACSLKRLIGREKAVEGAILTETNQGGLASTVRHSGFR